MTDCLLSPAASGPPVARRLALVRPVPADAASPRAGGPPADRPEAEEPAGTPAPAPGLVALVIGATRHGLALCRSLLAEGATVYVADADLGVAAAAAVGLGPGAHAFPFDPASCVDAQIVWGYLRHLHAGADLLVCAGTRIP